jgi:hypothetical protein
MANELRLPPNSPSPVDVRAVIDRRDSDTTSVVVDPVDDAEVASARGVEPGQFQMEPASDSLRIFR